MVFNGREEAAAFRVERRRMSSEYIQADAQYNCTILLTSSWISTPPLETYKVQQL